jgi:hypothetical protein
MLRNVERQFRTKASGQRVGTIFKGQVKTDRLSQNDGRKSGYFSTLSKIPEKRRPNEPFV